MISLALNHFSAICCALLATRIAFLYLTAKQKPAPVGPIALRRFERGGQIGFAALTTLLILQSIGSSHRQAWTETFFTGPLDLAHLGAVIAGFTAFRHWFDGCSVLAKNGLWQWTKEVGLATAAAAILCVVDYPAAFTNLFYGIRVVSYPVLTILVLLSFRTRKSAASEMVQPMPQTVAPTVSIHPTRISVAKAVYNNTTIIINNILLPESNKRSAITVESPPTSTRTESSTARLLDDLNKAQITDSLRRQIPIQPSVENKDDV